MKKAMQFIYSGQRGRPAAVRNTARNLIREAIARNLASGGIVPNAVTKAKVEDVCKWSASDALDALDKAGLCIIPAAIVHELSLMVGEPPPASAPAPLPPPVAATKPEPGRDNSTASFSHEIRIPSTGPFFGSALAPFLPAWAIRPGTF